MCLYNQYTLHFYHSSRSKRLSYLDLQVGVGFVDRFHSVLIIGSSVCLELILPDSRPSCRRRGPTIHGGGGRGGEGGGAGGEGGGGGVGGGGGEGGGGGGEQA